MIRRGSEDRQRRVGDNTFPGDVISVAVQTKGASGGWRRPDNDYDLIVEEAEETSAALFPIRVP